MKPSEKSPKLTRCLDGLSTKLFGMSRLDALHNNVCVICKGPASEFHDDLSRKEYSISAMCQACQDDTFKGAEECPTCPSD